MTRANKALVVFVVATLGIWGCAKGPNPTSGNLERIRSLEAKNTKLEDDFRNAAAVRDNLRKQLAAAEKRQAQLQREMEDLQVVLKERDELRETVKARQNERDAIQIQFDQFRKNIKELIGQAEAAMVRPVDPPVTSSRELALPPRS